MLLTDKHTAAVAKVYGACFLVLACWYIFHGISFSLLQPVFFAAQPDMTGHVIFSTGLQQMLISQRWLQVVFDAVVLLINPLLAFCFIRKMRFTFLLAWGTIVFNIVYFYLLSSMSFVSREPFIAWMFMPFLFTARSLPAFYFKFHVLRILFILFFATAGLWKMRGGGAFHTEQFSGILAHQYAAVLASGAKGWFVSLTRFLVNNPVTAFVLYWIVTLAELFFMAGLFTRRLDRWLLLMLVVFICFDYFLMEINYFSWLPFATLFYYSRAGLEKF
ncbi:MAG: hypothetical protein QM687_12195 [Ferruginibacter sp.]